MTATTALTIPSPTTAGGHGLGVGGGVTVLPPDVIPIKQDGLGQGEILTARVTRRGTESDVRIRILDFLGEGRSVSIQSIWKVYFLSAQ
ncbi:unnamed protein product [Cyprideis torosa]|uniref:Uncharacterized protein n=1 Tax=Cyprideis torosa TaxID=163714 RepID=A0A7R8VZX8_9CRUS|nr:unnamed protein product [Cyprideis torosa]CAG0879159.1 unnamed protein product [Cyprideis torosa]